MFRGKTKKRVGLPLTLDELSTAPTWKLCLFLVGWTGIALALLGGLGAVFAEEHWPDQVSEVLSAAMAPVAVLAASATLVFSNAMERLFEGSSEGRRRSAVQVVMAALCVGLTVLYFAFALGALSMPPGTVVRHYVVAFAYLWLGAVLGGISTVLHRLPALRSRACDGPRRGWRVIA